MVKQLDLKYFEEDFVKLLNRINHKIEESFQNGTLYVSREILLKEALAKTISAAQATSHAINFNP